MGYVYGATLIIKNLTTMYKQTPPSFGHLNPFIHLLYRTYFKYRTMAIAEPGLPEIHRFARRVTWPDSTSSQF